ncbi:uncharacterized protein [Venturia canescens]|uniref:uncharacterized protein n=1 Tax=Venturia canescens TaxID=32260 RepID=UPI001C9D01C3|nr:uncharacterized protein LOC122407921 [Venturia canescens]
MTYQEPTLGNRRDDDLYTIYVNNLPAELNEDGIAQIFNTYGKVCDLFTPSNGQWAYISYKSYKEAEHAIRSLNEQSPLYLNVAFRKKASKPANKNPPPPAQENGTSIDQRESRYIENIQPPEDNGQYPKMVPQLLAMKMANLCHDPSVDMNSVYPTELDHNFYNPFEQPGRYASTNAMWSRGCVSIDEYGRRSVTRGRGYTNYPVAEVPYVPIHNPLERVYENRRPGYYQYGNDRLEHGIGKCQFCLHSAKLRCARCDAYYCSQKCQLRDWPHHRMECVKIPPLIDDSVTPIPQTPEVARVVTYVPQDEPAPIPRKPRATIDIGTLGGLRRPRKFGTRNSVDPLSMEEQGKIPQVIGNGNSSVAQLENVPTEGTPIEETVQSSEPSKYGSSNHQEQKEHKSVEVDTNKKISTDPGKVDRKNVPANNPSIKTCAKTANGNALNCSINKSITDYEKTERDLAFKKDVRVPAKLNNPAVTPTPVEKPHIEQCNAKSIVQRTKTTSCISRDKFEDVRVVFTLPDKTFWVNKCEDVMKLESLMLGLTTKAVNYPKAENIIVGEMYAVQYEGLWHRAVVLSKTPDLIISYVDFGNEEPPQSHDFRLLMDFIDCPNLALRLRLSPNSDHKDLSPDEVLSVKMIGVNEQGIIDVIDHEETLSPPPKTEPSSTLEQVVQKDIAEPMKIPDTAAVRVTEKSVSNLATAIDCLKANGDGYLQVYVALDHTRYAVGVLSPDLMVEYEMIYEKLTDVCNQSEKLRNFSPEIGSFVCGKRGDVWLRGHVVSLGPPIRLSLVDEARVSQVEEIVPMPHEYEKIRCFGSIVTLENANLKFADNETAQFTITEITNEGNERIVKGILSVPEHMKGTRFSMRNWKPTPEQMGIAVDELKNNCEVYISAYRNERSLYVRSLDVQSLEHCQRITQNIAKWAQKAPKLEQPPIIGQCVIAKFVDGNYYRAIVTKVHDGKIEVSYVDFGNNETTTIEQLRVISDELKQPKSCAWQVLLKDITEGVPPTKEVHQYLDVLVGTEQPLICSFEGIPSKDGVVLTAANGECVNEKVNTYLKPNWQREDPSKNLECFMIDNLEVAPLGEVGQTVKVLPLFAPEPPFKYVMAPFDQELITHITGIMPGSLQKYCESTEAHYIPRAEELCLAVWDGAWYRGVCLNRSETPTQALIYFVDYGNTAVVNHKNIRQMTKDFMSPAALGISCVVKNLGVPVVNGRVPGNIMERLEQLVPVNGLVEVKILRKASPDDQVPLPGDYEIELPTVRAQLVAEGLVK